MVGKSAVQSASYLLWLQHVLVKRFWKPNWLPSVAPRCKDLQALAPSAEQLVRNFLIDMEAVNEMLRDQLQTGIGIAKGATGATFAQGVLLLLLPSKPFGGKKRSRDPKGPQPIYPWRGFAF